MNYEMESVLKERLCLIIGTISPSSRRSKEIYDGMQIENIKRAPPFQILFFFCTNLLSLVSLFLLL